jgi:hypothetical protein
MEYVMTNTENKMDIDVYKRLEIVNT